VRVDTLSVKRPIEVVVLNCCAFARGAGASQGGVDRHGEALNASPRIFRKAAFPRCDPFAILKIWVTNIFRAEKQGRPKSN
jgi:hypothetical protein